jgi:hypothetical protein
MEFTVLALRTGSADKVMPCSGDRWLWGMLHEITAIPESLLSASQSRDNRAHGVSFRKVSVAE